MKARSVNWTPVLVTVLIIVFVCFLQSSASFWEKHRLNFFQRLEWNLYDLRMRSVANPAARLGAVLIDNDSIRSVQDGDWGGGNTHYGLYWPRFIYGLALRELRNQGAKAVAFDVLFGDARPDHPKKLENNQLIESDVLFARELRLTTNTILAARQELVPIDLFRTNASALGDIATQVDSDGVLRRVKAFQNYTNWHPVLQRAARLRKLNLSYARLSPSGLEFLSATHQTNAVLPLSIDQQQRFDLAEFKENLQRHWEISFEDESWTNYPERDQLYLKKIVWSLGIVLAAVELGLDLEQARIDSDRRQVILPGPGAQARVIPLDADDCLSIDWSLSITNDLLVKAAFEDLLTRDAARQLDTPELRAELASGNLFSNRLVVIGSIATGSDLQDLVATPLAEKTFGISQHWNVANMVLNQRFIRAAGCRWELMLTVFMGLLSAWLTWHLRVIWASVWIAGLMLVYLAGSAMVFAHWRLWLPVAFPLFGGLLPVHVGLVTYRVIFEQQERRRMKSVFSKVVSPDVVNELLSMEKLSLGGARRQITVYFADVRGFTEFTDEFQAAAEEVARERRFSQAEAELFFDERATELLNTVSLYLGRAAEIIKKHGGTLDKYIGDSVMAFWGAPTPNEKNALGCVRAAIEVQRAIQALNDQREQENRLREAQNAARLAKGEPAMPMLPILALGTGINTGSVLVGMMGSDADILNYTVLGREVNVASRLEGVSGRSRIIISESTYQELLRDEPVLAKGCQELKPVLVKGIRQPVRIYQVPWDSAPTLTSSGPAPSPRHTAA